MTVRESGACQPEQQKVFVVEGGLLTSVQAEVEVALDSGVDESDPVLLPRLKSRLPLLARDGAAGVVRVGAVDESRFHRGRRALVGRVPELKGGRVSPVLQEEEAQVLVVVGGGGSVQNQRPEQTLAVLQAEVTVVPRTPVLHDAELVDHALAWGDGTLADAGHAVHMGGVELAEAVPVHSCCITSHVVVHVNLEGISPVGLILGQQRL